MFLFDTNFVSELRRIDKADRRVVDWTGGVKPFDAYLSVISVQELEIGVLQIERRDAIQGRLLREWLDRTALPAFRGRILPVTEAIALRSAQLHVPDPRPYRDTLIAATAYVHGMTVVTRNVADFDGCGVAVLNPFEETPEHSMKERKP